MEKGDCHSQSCELCVASGQPKKVATKAVTRINFKFLFMNLLNYECKLKKRNKIDSSGWFKPVVSNRRVIMG